VLKVCQSPSAAMTGWVAGGEAPSAFTLDQDLELRSTEKATVRYAKHSLDGEEIRQHIAAGKVVTRLAMTWNDRISFVLNDLLQIKRLAFLDILKEQAEARGQATDDAKWRRTLRHRLHPDDRRSRRNCSTTCWRPSAASGW
jgi:recombination associated protein RdgC